MSCLHPATVLDLACLFHLGASRSDFSFSISFITKFIKKLLLTRWHLSVVNTRYQPTPFEHFPPPSHQLHAPQLTHLLGIGWIQFILFAKINNCTPIYRVTFLASQPHLTPFFFPFTPALYHLPLLSLPHASLLKTCHSDLTLIKILGQFRLYLAGSSCISLAKLAAHCTRDKYSKEII